MAKHSNHLTHAQQNAILSRYEWLDSGTKRVQSTHATEPLLKLAGVLDPRVMEFYRVPVRQDAKGLWIVDTDSGKRPPQSESDDELYEAGGLFAGEERPASEVVGVMGSARAEIAEGLAELVAITRTRTFEIRTGPTSKVRVMMVAYEDEALPVPLERERWVPKKPNAADVLAAAHTLTVCRDLAHHELI